jgi:hypothetical protein
MLLRRIWSTLVECEFLLLIMSVNFKSRVTQSFVNYLYLSAKKKAERPRQPFFFFARISDTFFAAELNLKVADLIKKQYASAAALHTTR